MSVEERVSPPFVSLLPQTPEEERETWRVEMCISTNCLWRHSSGFLPLPRSSSALDPNTKDEMLLLLFELWTVMRTLQKLLFFFSQRTLQETQFTKSYQDSKLQEPESKLSSEEILETILATKRPDRSFYRLNISKSVFILQSTVFRVRSAATFPTSGGCEALNT